MLRNGQLNWVSITTRHTRHFEDESYHVVDCTVSSVTGVGLTRGGNWRCHPYFFLKKTGDPFSHHRLSAASHAVLHHPYLFSPEKLTTFFAHHSHFFYLLHSGVTPPLEGVTPHLFYLSDLVCPLLFVNSVANFFRSGVNPWRVSPGAVRLPLPALLVTPLCTGTDKITENKGTE